jgi:hypothetical protein
MTEKNKKYPAVISDIFIIKYIYIHIGYWIFYILFFTVQRFAFSGYNDFIPNLKLNLAYLPIILICTYLVTEYLIPDMFNRKNLILTGPIFVLIIVVEPVFVYLLGKRIPY